MPNLTFVLPHWIYWSGLALFPLVVMFFVARERRHGEPRRFSLPVVYLLWLTGGFVGLHRFYCRSWWGVIYLPLFVAVLYGNVVERDARDAVSAARNEIAIAEFELERAQKTAADDGAEAERRVAERRDQLQRARAERETAAAHLERAEIGIRALAILIGALLLIDAVLLPRLTRRCRALEPAPPPRPTPDWAYFHAERDGRPERAVHLRVTDALDAISGFTGQFVAYWSVIAVFVYYYEVLARYVFNSPTNWAHESMFLMFGMQYLLAGAFALREDAHVRVDVIYMRFPRRMKALTDVITSLFFFIFCAALLWTGWTFAWDSMQVWEVSFTEWAIQYWPVKLAIPIGALLILLQGLSKLIKDIAVLIGREA